jgi:hypothetical protein
MRKVCLGAISAGLLAVCATTSLADPGPPRTFLVNPAALVSAREAFRGGDKGVLPAVKRLLKDADKTLEVRALSVMDKEQVPPSGDRHDYMSLSRYWWPDSSKPNGLPYVRRDGVTNPEIDRISDHNELSKLIRSVGTLSLGYYFSGDEKYAAHASHLLRAWFLDSATLMHPNLEYAQSVPGRSEGRGAGIIDAHLLPEVIDAVGLLAGSASWSSADQRGLEAWFADYLRWLRGSENGRREASAKNNHGTWYDVQVGAVALFVGDSATAVAILRDARSKRIATQIEPDGSQPAELQRTKSWDYSFFNLTALFRLASLGERAGVDLWRYETSDGRSIRRSVDWVLPFLAGEQKWSHEQIQEQKTAGIAPLFLEAAKVWNEEAYRLAAEKVGGFNPRNDRCVLFLWKGKP